MHQQRISVLLAALGGLGIFIIETLLPLGYNLIA